MKLFFSVLFVLMTLIVSAFCKEENAEDYDYSIKLLINSCFDKISQEKVNNFNLDFGLSYFGEKDFMGFRRESNKPCYEKDCEIIQINFLHLGLNLKTDDFKEFDNKLNFTLINSYVISNIGCSKSILYGKLNILNLKSDIFFEKKEDYVNLDLGLGYDFINQLDKHLIIIAFVGIGSNNYKLDKKIFSNIKGDSLLNSNCTQFQGGIKVKLLFNPIAFDMNSEYKRASDKYVLNTYTVSAKILYIHQKKNTQINIDYGWDYLKKYFDLYISCDYNRFSISDFYQEIFRFSAGVDVYINSGFFDYYLSKLISNLM